MGKSGEMSSFFVFFGYEFLTSRNRSKKTEKNAKKSTEAVTARVLNAFAARFAIDHAVFVGLKAKNKHLTGMKNAVQHKKKLLSH